MNPAHTGQINAPPYSRSEIIRTAEDLIRRYVAAVGREKILQYGMCFKDLYEHVVYPDFEIELIDGEAIGIGDAGGKNLGLFDVEGNTVFIDNSIGPHSGDPRRTFTLHHEVLGHGVLHGPWLRSDIKRLRQAPFFVTTEASLDPAVMNTLEQQANLLAAHTSAPAWLIEAAIILCFRPTKPFVYFEPCEYWLDVRGQNRRYHVGSFNELCRLVAFHIRGKFDGLSIESLSYRVRECRWMADRSQRIRLSRVAV